MNLAAPGLLVGDSDPSAAFSGGDGVGQDHLTTPLGDAWLDGDWSIIFLLNADAITGGNVDILGTEDSISNTRGLVFRTTTSLLLLVNNASSGQVVLNITGELNVTLTAGVRYHVAATYHAATGAVATYLDGQPSATATVADGFANDSPFNIGEVYRSGLSTPTTRARRWNGRVDEPVIFDRVLTGDDVLHLHRRAAGVLHHP